MNTFDKKCVCIIGARKGSKRLPGKNRLPLCGKPLYRHTLNAALTSDLFESIVFTTDDDLIVKELEGEERVLIDHRPVDMANDTATMMDVVFDLMERHRDVFIGIDHLCILTPCNPFRGAEQIRTAYGLIVEHQGNALMSITEFPFPPELALDIERQRVCRSWNGPARPANYRKRFYPNGAVIIVNRNYFRQYRDFYPRDTIGFILGWPECIDIDLPEDYELARLIMENRYRPDPV